MMAGAVRFAAECETEPQQLYWAKVTLGDLEVLKGTAETVKAAYKEAIAKNDKDWFALIPAAQLQLLKDWAFARNGRGRHHHVRTRFTKTGPA